MGTYEIIFERENGIIGIDFFCANSKSIALQEFEKAYRYRSGKLISCTRIN